jgi:hypothetical protein
MKPKAIWESTPLSALVSMTTLIGFAGARDGRSAA